MRYFGGKARVSNKICEYINGIRTSTQPYLEPFVGGGWILSKINPVGNRIASDLCEPLIKMYQELQNGWIPPDTVTREEYQKAKDGDYPDHLQAFIGFGCSFAGKWFGGYANTVGRNYATNAKNSIEKKMKNLIDVQFLYKDYRDYKDLYDHIIYCDPPYKGTTGFSAIGKFDSNEFWDIMREWGKNNTVLISEYNAPDDFRSVLEITTKLDVRTKDGNMKRTEKLFTI